MVLHQTTMGRLASITFRPVCCRALCTFLSQHFALLSKASSPKQLLYSEFWHFALSKRRTARRAALHQRHLAAALRTTRWSIEPRIQSSVGEKGNLAQDTLLHREGNKSVAKRRSLKQYYICILEINVYDYIMITVCIYYLLFTQFGNVYLYAKQSSRKNSYSWPKFFSP